MARFQISRILDFGPIRLGLSQEFHIFCEQEQLQKHATLDKNPYCVYGKKHKATRARSRLEELTFGTFNVRTARSTASTVSAT